MNDLKSWFDSILQKGPLYGYHAEPSKSWLIVKEEKLEEAKTIFAGTAVTISSTGKKHLGAVIGHPDHKREFVSKLVEEWVSLINAQPMLSPIPLTPLSRQVSGINTHFT